MIIKLPERSLHSTLCKGTRDTIKLPYDFSCHAFRGAHIIETCTKKFAEKFTFALLACPL